MNEFHFLRPYFLLLLIPFFALVYLLMRQKDKSNVWNRICSKDLLPYILVDRPIRSKVLFYGLIGTGLFFLVTALSGPTWQTLPQPLIQSRSSLAIVLDLSPAMDAEDIKPSRLKRAIYKIKDLLDARKEGQTALVVFSGDPFVVTPLTDDPATIKALLPVLDTTLMPSPGHNVAKAIVKASELFTQAGKSEGSILLVTSALTSGEAEKIAGNALKEGIDISVLGVGTDENAPIPKIGGGFVTDDKGALVIAGLAKENLSRLAKQTKGVYVTIGTDDRDVQVLTDHFVALQTMQNQNATVLSQTNRHDQGYLFVLPVLPLFCLLFRRGVLSAVCLFLPQLLQASLSDEFFKTPDRRAEEFFHEGNYEKANELFQNRDWQAATKFRLGDYQAAAEALKENRTAEGLYNCGTAKAKLGDFKGALKDYRAALELEPDHEDALFNKKLIEDLQDQDQNKDPQEDSSEDNEENEQQQDSSGTGSRKDRKQEKSEQKQDSDNSEKGERNEEKAEKQDSKSDGDVKEDKTDSRSQQEKKQEEKELQEDYKKKLDKELRNEQDQGEECQAEKEQEDSPEDRRRQIDDRWLQRIPDDPGALLRRKFLYQYKNQKTGPGK